MSTAPTTPPTGPTGPALVAAVQLLEQASAKVAALTTPAVLTGLSDELVGQIATRLAAVTETTQAGTWAALARVADSGLPQAQGADSAGAWWREQTRASTEGARTQVRLARRLARHYEATTAAWQGGDRRVEHAQVIAGGVDAVLHRHARRIRRERQAAGEAVSPAALSEELAGMRTALEATLVTAATPSVDADGREVRGRARRTCALCWLRRGSWLTRTGRPRRRWPANSTPVSRSTPSATWPS